MSREVYGEVSVWFPRRGFGFVRVTTKPYSNGPEAFVHWSDLIGFREEAPYAGERVTLELADDGIVESCARCGGYWKWDCKLCQACRDAAAQEFKLRRALMEGGTAGWQSCQQPAHCRHNCTAVPPDGVRVRRVES